MAVSPILVASTGLIDDPDGRLPLQIAAVRGRLQSAVTPIEDDDGSAWRPEEPWQREAPDFYKQQILEEDEEMLAIIQMFLTIMDD